MTTTTISVNQLAQPLVEKLCAQAEWLGVRLSYSKAGVRVVDAGIDTRGSLEAGRLIAEICLGGLGRVQLTHGGVAARWPLSVHVHTSQPVIACLASQYAGWGLSDKQGEQNFQALGSGPARALARREPLFEELDYQDSADTSVLVLEVNREPPATILDKIVTDCQITHDKLTVILTPTCSLAGSMQVVARIVEVGLHKVHTLGFNLADIVDASGSAPLAPPANNFIQGMGRTNDAILFAGRIHLFVTGNESAAQVLAQQLPSSTSRDYGKPFAEVFKDYDYDFFKIDPLLFSPAQVAVTHLPSGQTFHSGTIALDLLDKSFG